MRGSSWARRIRENEDEQDLDETHLLLSDQPQHKLVGGAGGASGLGYILGWIVTMTASAFLLYWFIREVGWLKDDHYQQSWGGIVTFGLLGIVGLTSLIGLGCFKANQKRTGTIWVTHWLSLAFIPVVIIFGLSVWKFWIEKSHPIPNDDLLVLPKTWLLALCGIALAGLLIVQWTSLTLADRDYTQDMYQWTLFVSYLCLMQAGLGIGVLLVLSLNQVPEFMTSLSAWSVWAGLVFAAVQAIVAIMGMAKPLDNFRVMYILLPIASLVLAVCCFFNYTLSGHLNTLFPDIKGKYTTIDINGESRHAYLVITSALGIVWSVAFTILVLFGVLTYDEGNHGKRGGCDCLCCGSEDGSRYTAYA